MHSSKAVGEPPTFLGGSVFFAVKDAIRAARQELQQGAEHGVGVGVGVDHVVLNVPATYERVRMACGGPATAAAGGGAPGEFRAKTSN